MARRTRKWLSIPERIPRLDASVVLDHVGKKPAALFRGAAGAGPPRRFRLCRTYSGGWSGAGAACTFSAGLRAGVAAMLALAARM